MKIPSVQSTEGVLLLAAVAFAAYVAYKAYKTGSAIGTGITEQISAATDFVKQTIDSADVAVTSAGSRGRSILNGGAIPITADQSDAETARLNRGNDAITDSMPSKTTPSYDSMGNYQGTSEEVGLGSDSATFAYSQDYSPSALLTG